VPTRKPESSSPSPPRVERTAASDLSPLRFELWDAELGLVLGAFSSEAEALAAVRRLCAQSAGSRAPLGLVEDQRSVVASGDALVDRAFNANLYVDAGRA
jgi:hypothetical protein